MSNYIEVTNALNIPKSQLRACINSRASQHYSPDCDAFMNYCPINNTTITTADGCKLKAAGRGNVQIELLNSVKCTKTTIKEAIHTPDMVFTLISVSQLNDMKCSTTFSGGICMIKSLTGHTMVTIPCANGLYCVTAVVEPQSTNYASVVLAKMTMIKVHHKLRHIMHRAIKYMIMKGQITSIKLDPESKPEFCEACAKAKPAQQPFLKELETHALEYSEYIHWDLWGLATVRSLSGNLYTAA